MTWKSFPPPLRDAWPCSHGPCKHWAAWQVRREKRVRTYCCRHFEASTAEGVITSIVGRQEYATRRRGPYPGTGNPD